MPDDQQKGKYMRRIYVLLLCAALVTVVVIGWAVNQPTPTYDEAFTTPTPSVYATPVIAGPKTQEDEYVRTNAAAAEVPVRVPVPGEVPTHPVGTPSGTATS